jgi:predicted RNase H-like HicB family nuclease
MGKDNPKNFGTANSVQPPPAAQYPYEALHTSDYYRTQCGGFYVSCPPLQGCYSQGDTYDEALSNIKDAIRLQLEDRQADHDELSEPKSFSLSTVEVSL